MTGLEPATRGDKPRSAVWFAGLHSTKLRSTRYLMSLQYIIPVQNTNETQVMNFSPMILYLDLKQLSADLDMHRKY